jgi:predicted LPLAT superfamily acyltransferase
MTQDWRSLKERSSPTMLRLIVWLAASTRRPVVRPLLYPIVAYFLLTSAESRAASRSYLRRTLGHEPAWLDQWRHFFAFASCTLDRVFFLTEKLKDIDVSVNRPENVRAMVARHPGCLLFVAHFGSAEALRVIGVNKRGLPLSILLDRNHGRMLTELLEEVNPQLADTVIDASERGPMLVLRLKETLEEGRMVGIMADRALPTDRSVQVDLLGGKARLPVGPWQLASALKVPVILGFGCYLGDNRYAAHFELFAESITLPRENREDAIKKLAQRYAKRLEYYTHLAPYNWFNFYDFWPTESPTSSSAAVKEIANPAGQARPNVALGRSPSAVSAGAQEQPLGKDARMLRAQDAQEQPNATTRRSNPT